MKRKIEMDYRQLAAEINRLKIEKNAIILVHNYQIGPIQDIADYLGDSLGLARQAAETDNPLIIFCGVRFMAETAKILSPNKKVLLPRKEAGCPMADMADVETLKQIKSQHPNAKVVTYVNSTAEVKAESDVCCTSANAVEIVQNLSADEIIFTPDKNLAAYVQRFTDKKINLWDGFCYVHDRFSRKEVEQARKNHPDGLLMVHPECRPEVIDLADEVLSTGGMVKIARTSNQKKFLVATEDGMLYRLKKENPDKEFLSVGSVKMCSGMKITRLEDVYTALAEEKYEISLPEKVMDRARTSLERMLGNV